MTKKTKITLIVIAAVLILGGVGYWYWGVYMPKKKVAQTQTPQAETPPSKEEANKE